MSAYGENYVDEDECVLGWQPIEGYEHSAWIGNYDGDGHIVTNLYRNGSGYDGGIFSEVFGDIKNLGVIVDKEINLGMGGGVIAKTVERGGVVENCWVKGSGKVYAEYCGAILYALVDNSKMKNCYADILLR